VRAFTEGFDTTDLQAACDVLDGMRIRPPTASS
jgi:hypothetical protein